MAEAIHYLILTPSAGSTACGLEVRCFYPHIERAEERGSGRLMRCTVALSRVTCQQCDHMLERPADIRHASKNNGDDRSESSRRE